MHFKSLLLTFMLLSVPLGSQAATLYVAPGATGSACEKNDPCGNVQQAIGLASAGDRVQLSKGTFTENITIPGGKNGLVISGRSKFATILLSDDGDSNPKFAPAGVAADIVVDIFSSNVIIQNLTIRHPKADASKRDIGVFVRPPALNVKLRRTIVDRQRNDGDLEPTTPGSRGILVFRATGTRILENTFTGNYQDHIHLPTSRTLVYRNSVRNATRLGIVVIQENAISDSTLNRIIANTVTKSSGDGIQIQGDSNVINNNMVRKNGGYGIHLCGPGSSPACVAPSGASIAASNVVKGNKLIKNDAGSIEDNGSGNIIKKAHRGHHDD